jgi:single-strand DNA-binding protein
MTGSWRRSGLTLVAWGSLAENLAESVRRGDGSSSRVASTAQLGNNQGDKRSKIEITANEVAPSLRWATVEISKNQRATAQTVPAGNGAGSDQESLSNTRREPATLNGERRQPSPREGQESPRRRRSHSLGPPGPGLLGVC